MKQYKPWQKVVLIICPVISAVCLYFFADFILSHFPLPECMTYKLFGIYCPGCGMTRAVTALLNFDILLSLRQNAFIVVGIIILLLLYIQLVLRLFCKRTISFRLSKNIIYIMLAIAAVYSVARNFIPAIAPI